MTYVFSGTPEGMMTSLFSDLKRARGESLGAEAAFREALVSLVGLHHAQAVHGAVDSSRLARFRQESAAAMLEFPQRLGFQVNEALILAEGANEYEWPELCMCRSVIQFLIDDYADTPIPGLIDRKDLAELDEELERVGEQQGPLDANQIPKGMPATHWWWRYPKNDSAEEPGPAAEVNGAAEPGDAGGQAARATLVLDPQFAFDSLRNALPEAGWQLVSLSQRPIIPGEPEHALFERDTTHLAYSFNPVCSLRLLEVPLDLDHETVARLPVQNVDDVKPWLMSADERTQLRGIFAAGYLPHPAMLAGVEKLTAHPRASIAQAARQSAEKIRLVLKADDEARATARAATQMLETQLTPLIRALAADTDGSLTAALRPQADDYARAFVAEIAEAARAAYEALWLEPPRVSSTPGGSTLKLSIAPAGMLLEENELSRGFPRGYRSIAPLMDPHRVWVAWKLIAPGKDSGVAYDGLVWLDDHWAWFPKPYRVLAALAQARAMQTTERGDGAPGRS